MKSGLLSIIVMFVFCCSCSTNNSIRDQALATGQRHAPPEPVGGFGAIHKYLEYPTDAEKNKIEGKVIIDVPVNFKL